MALNKQYLNYDALKNRIYLDAILKRHLAFKLSRSTNLKINNWFK